MVIHWSVQKLRLLSGEMVFRFGDRCPLNPIQLRKHNRTYVYNTNTLHMYRNWPTSAIWPFKSILIKSPDGMQSGSTHSENVIRSSEKLQIFAGSMYTCKTNGSIKFHQSDIVLRPPLIVLFRYDDSGWFEILQRIGANIIIAIDIGWCVVFTQNNFVPEYWMKDR